MCFDLPKSEVNNEWPKYSVSWVHVFDGLVCYYLSTGNHVPVSRVDGAPEMSSKGLLYIPGQETKVLYNKKVEWFKSRIIRC